jgi:hypothetical protein
MNANIMEDLFKGIKTLTKLEYFKFDISNFTTNQIKCREMINSLIRNLD